MKNVNWTRVLTILLVILASFAVIYIVGMILLRFKQAILLFMLGAILAYILAPLANRLERLIHLRWLAILLAYLIVAVGIVLLGVLLFTPFVQQSQSLIDNLRTPSSSSLTHLRKVQTDADALKGRISSQDQALSTGAGLTATQVRKTRSEISALLVEINALQGRTVHGRHQTRQPKQTTAPPDTTRVPLSYVADMRNPVNQLSSAYVNATPDPANTSEAQFSHAVSAANTADNAVHSIYQTMVNTPILAIKAQDWLDGTPLKIDLHSKFGEAASQVSNQGTSILGNAITILSYSATLLLNSILILILSIYFLGDGRRVLRGAVNLLPHRHRDQAWFFIASVDQVLGGYIRGQLLISTAAGILGGGAAFVLGVPYPLLIGIMTFILESVPVIGPMVVMVPAVLIAIVFNGVITGAIMLAWFVVYQQVLTNILGPRIMGQAVGIHPLEAMGAVLIGFPLGGLLGAFLAVPIAGIVHIVIREAYAYFALGKALPTAKMPEVLMEEEELRGAGAQAVPASTSGPEPTSAGT